MSPGAARVAAQTPLPTRLQGRFVKHSKLLLALCLAGPLWAHAGFTEGLAAAEKADYLTALRHWQPLAAEGHPAAQYNLGQMYEQGLGLPRNSAFAAHWYRKAADQGHEQAQRQLERLQGRSAP